MLTELISFQRCFPIKRKSKMYPQISAYIPSLPPHTRHRLLVTYQDIVYFNKGFLTHKMRYEY